MPGKTLPHDGAKYIKIFHEHPHMYAAFKYWWKTGTSGTNLYHIRTFFIFWVGCVSERVNKAIFYLSLTLKHSQDFLSDTNQFAGGLEAAGHISVSAMQVWTFIFRTLSSHLNNESE